MYVSSANIGRGGGELATAVNFTGSTPLGLSAIRAMLDNVRVRIIDHYTRYTGSDVTDDKKQNLVKL
jgi:hypothetical protein